jgi:hypothetical protein
VLVVGRGSVSSRRSSEIIAAIVLEKVSELSERHMLYAAVLQQAPDA